MTPKRRSLVLFEADKEQRLSGTRARAGGDIDSLVRHAHSRLRRGDDHRQVAADTHASNPHAHTALMNSLEHNDSRRDAMESAPVGRRLAHAHVALSNAYDDASRQDRELPHDHPAMVAVEKAVSEHKEAENAVIPSYMRLSPEDRRVTNAGRYNDARREGLGRFLHRSFFPKGEKGTRHHVRSITRTHGFFVNSKNVTPAITATGTRLRGLPHAHGLRRALEGSGYGDSHNIEVKERPEDDIYSHPEVSVTLTPKKKS